MGKEDAKRLINDMKSDESLQKKGSQLSDLEAVLGFAKENGYEISAEELQNACNDVELEEKELSDEELEHVAGGKKTFFAGAGMGGFLYF